MTNSANNPYNGNPAGNNTFFNQNIIVEAYDSRAIYEIATLPQFCDIILNGKILKKKDRFTQADIRAGNLKLHQRVCLNYDAKHTTREDSFKFRVPLPDKTYLTDIAPDRSTCLPAANVPKNGLYTFAINILIIPNPQVLVNAYPTIMEDASLVIDRHSIYYSSDTKTIDAFYNPQEQPINAYNQALDKWKRFTGDTFYENAAKDAPVDSDASRWEFADDGTIIVTSNTTSYNGIVSTEARDQFRLSARLSSINQDDDYLGLVIAYKEVGGVPHTLSVIRSGGGTGITPAVQTYLLISTVGNTRTILQDMSAMAPNLLGNAQSQAWADLGDTMVEITRRGDAVTIQCSQFGNKLPLDPATMVSITVPSEFAGPCQYGYSSYSQANGLFSKMTFTDLLPVVVPPVPDPASQPLFERYPVTYTITGPGKSKLATFFLRGAPIKTGDTFTTKDLDAGNLVVKGNFVGEGDVQFSFRVISNDMGCNPTYGTFKVFVKQWPFPKTKANQITMVECSTATLNQKLVEFFVEETGYLASRPDQVSISFDAEKTVTYNQDQGLVSPSQGAFTQQDINDGKISFTHNCDGAALLKRSEILWFNVCTQHNKCRSLPVGVEITPLPVVQPPLEPGISVDGGGCTYKGNFTGDGRVLVGQCGTWVELSGRVVPLPSIPGQIIYIPNAPQGPVTLLTVPNDSGQLEHQQLPYNITTQPDPAAGPGGPDGGSCPRREVAPNTDRSKSYIELDVWGDYGLYAPAFDLVIGTTVVKSGVNVDKLTARGQAGNQVFGFNVPTATLQSGPVKIVFTKNEASGTADTNLTINSITVNGAKFGGNALQIKSAGNAAKGLSNGAGKLTAQGDYALTPSGPYQPAPYIGPPNTCFIAPDNTQWVTDANGIWSPVEGTWLTPLPDWTPIIKADFDLVKTETLELPPLGKLLWHPPTKTVFTQQPETAEPAYEASPYTKTLSMDQFLWIGPNEFWVPFGTSFDLDLFSNRWHTRMDIMPTNGHTIVSPVDPVLIRNNDTSKSILAARGYGTNPFNSNTTGSIESAMGEWAGYGKQKVYKVKTVWEDNIYQPAVTDPYVMGSYLVKLSGTSSYAGFVATTRPKLVPETYTGPIYANAPKNIKTVTAWTEDYSKVFTYSGFKDNLRQFRPNYALTQLDKIYAYGGADFGIVYPFLQFSAWKQANNLNYNPHKQALGWHVGRLKFLDAPSINFSMSMLQGGPVNTDPPRFPTTFTFQVRAFDTLTGEERIRVFTIHYNATGLNPKTKKSSAVTDTFNHFPGDPSVDPPPTGTAFCSFSDTGAIGSCTFIGSYKPGSYK